MLRNTSKADGFDSGIDHRGPTNTVQSVFFWVILGRNYEGHCSLKISYGTIAVNSLKKGKTLLLFYRSPKYALGKK